MFDVTEFDLVANVNSFAGLRRFDGICGAGFGIRGKKKSTTKNGSEK